MDRDIDIDMDRDTDRDTDKDLDADIERVSRSLLRCFGMACTSQKVHDCDWQQHFLAATQFSGSM